MSQGTALTVAVTGIEGHLVDVSAILEPGLPGFLLIGLPNDSETRDRVRAALANSGHPVKSQRIQVELSPGTGNLGTGFDLAIAVALLSAAAQITRPDERSRKFVYVAELGLDGRIRPVRGVFAATLAATQAGVMDVVVAEENAAEATLAPSARVHGVRHLNDVIALHERTAPARTVTHLSDRARQPRLLLRQPDNPPPRLLAAPDLRDVIGSPEGRRAVEIAAAGGHHLLLIGLPGAGKTLLATRLPGLLPNLSDPEALEVTAIHSVAATLDPPSELIRHPPFVAPHHTSTLTSLIGGGSGLPRPGALSRAHRGILFLDEAPEFDHHILDTLPARLDQGEIVIHQAHGATRFPARFQLVLATSPCPDLRHGPGQDCICAPAVRRRYLGRIPAGLLDRIDLQITMAPISPGDLISASPGEDTATVAARVAQARTAQRHRLSGTPFPLNAQAPSGLLHGALRLPPGDTQDIDRAREHGHLSADGYDTVLRIAWTLSDLDGRTRPDRGHLLQAFQLRQPGSQG